MVCKGMISKTGLEIWPSFGIWTKWICRKLSFELELFSKIVTKIENSLDFQTNFDCNSSFCAYKINNFVENSRKLSFWRFFLEFEFSWDWFFFSKFPISTPALRASTYWISEKIKVTSTQKRRKKPYMLEYSWLCVRHPQRL